MPIVMRCFGVAALALLSGCSYLFGEQGYFPDESKAYQDAAPVAPLQVPEDLDDSALQEIYAIPAVGPATIVTDQDGIPRPAPLVSSSSDQLVRIQRLGREEWILVELPPGQLWPQVRAYLSATARPVARVEARSGLIETSWLENEQKGMQERYQFRLEQGVQRNTAELHVLQMYRAGDVTSWPEVSAESEREREMLLDLAQFIANNTETAPVSMMAQQSLSDGGKISLEETSSGEPFIRLLLDFNRAWASVSRALEKSGFEISDKDRGAARYVVSYVEPEEEDSGWFDWLFDGDKEAALETFGGKLYEFTVEQAGDNEQIIRVTGEAGQPLGAREAQSLLVLLKGNIT